MRDSMQSANITLEIVVVCSKHTVKFGVPQLWACGHGTKNYQFCNYLDLHN